LIGPSVGIYTDTHEVDVTARQTSERGAFAKPVKISDDCWIGAHVVILPGVTIGRGCTISAGAVVVKDIEENSLAAGVPAKVVRKLGMVDEEN